MGHDGLLGMVEGQTERNTLQMNRKRISPARKVRQNPINAEVNPNSQIKWILSNIVPKDKLLGL